MQYSHEVEQMVCVAKGPHHGPAPIPEEGKWVQAKEVTDISGLTHGKPAARAAAGRVQADPERQNGSSKRRWSRPSAAPA